VISGFVRHGVRAFAAAWALLLAGTAAHASPFVYMIGTSNLGSGYGGPFATATVSLTSPTTANVTFDSLTNGGFTYLMGDGGTVAVNVNATSWNIGSFSSQVLAGFGSPALSNAGAGNEDGLGSFNQKVNSDGGFTHASTEISFRLTNTGGTWSSGANVLALNSRGYLAAIHAFACSEPACSASGSAAITGFAAGGTDAIPEPGNYAMLLSGLGLLGLLMRRRRAERRGGA